MKIIDNTPIENFDTDWGDPDGTGMKEKSKEQVQKFIKKKFIGLGYTFLGKATPSTMPATITIEDKFLYIATEEGDYSNFGLGEITEMSVIKSVNGCWELECFSFIVLEEYSFDTASNAYVTSTGKVVNSESYKVSDYIYLKEIYKVKGWDGGTLYDMKAISFYDENYNYLGYYDFNRPSGRFDIIFSEIEKPEGAYYVKVSQLNSIPTNLLLYKNKLHEKGVFLGLVSPETKIPAIPDGTDAFYIANEVGFYDNLGLEVPGISLIKYSGGKWRIHELVSIVPFTQVAGSGFIFSGDSSRFGLVVTVQAPYSYFNLIKADDIYRIKGWDGGTSYIMKAILFYDKNYNCLGYYDFNRPSGTFDIIFSEIEKPEGTYYVGISQYNSSPTTIFIKKQASENLYSWQTSTKITQNRLALPLFWSLPKEDNYAIKFNWDDKYSSLMAGATVYKATADLKNLVKIGTLPERDVWMPIVRDEENPLIYIYKASVPDTALEEPFYINISFKSLNPNILDNQVENNENKISSIQHQIENLSESWAGTNVVVFGDSITEFKDASGKTYSDYIAELTGSNIINVGVGGTQFRQRAQPVVSPTTTTEAYAALDIINIVKASCDSDFEKQTNAATYLKDNTTDNNIAIVEKLQNIDWSSVHAVIIMAGTNDWNNASSKWGDSNSSDVNYTFGAINEIVRLLLTTYPHVKLYWFTPTVRWLTDNEGNRTADTWSDNFMRNNKNLREFSAMVFETVSLHHIPICDMYNTLGWNMYNFDQFFSSTDGTHPTKGKGMEEIAKKIVSFINANKTF